MNEQNNKNYNNKTINLITTIELSRTLCLGDFNFDRIKQQFKEWIQELNRGKVSKIKSILLTL